MGVFVMIDFQFDFEPSDKIEVKQGVIYPYFDIEISSQPGVVTRHFIGNNSLELCTVVWDKQTIDRMG